MSDISYIWKALLMHIISLAATKHWILHFNYYTFYEIWYLVLLWSDEFAVINITKMVFVYITLSLIAGKKKGWRRLSLIMTGIVRGIQSSDEVDCNIVQVVKCLELVSIFLAPWSWGYCIYIYIHTGFAGVLVPMIVYCYKAFHMRNTLQELLVRNATQIVFLIIYKCNLEGHIAS